MTFSRASRLRDIFKGLGRRGNSGNPAGTADDATYSGKIWSENISDVTLVEIV